MHSAGCIECRPPRNQLVLESLMIPFTMIVVDELCDGPPEVMLADWNDSIQALLFDRPHEPCCSPREARRNSARIVRGSSRKRKIGPRLRYRVRASATRLTLQFLNEFQLRAPISGNGRERLCHNVTSVGERPLPDHVIFLRDLAPQAGFEPSNPPVNRTTLPIDPSATDRDEGEEEQ